MRIATDDRKTAAVIRDTAMELFAARGSTEVTVREVAAAAGVSPGLVMHHFGSKNGLKDAVDRRAVVFFDEMVAELVRIGDEGAAASVAEVFAARLEQEPALMGYVGRLLLEGGEAADGLFRVLFETTLTGMQSLVANGVARPSRDEQVRAAFVLVNDLALVLLRRQVERAIGADPLSRPGVLRWTAEVLDVYTAGLFVGPTAAPTTSQRRSRRGREQV